MNVLNVNSYIDLQTGGGTAERTFKISKFLALQNIKCTVLTINNGVSESVTEDLKPAHIVLIGLLWRRYFVPVMSWKTIMKLVNDSDIVHLMGHWSFLNALVYIAIRRSKKPYVVCPAGSLQLFGRSKYLKTIYNFVIGRRIIKNASAWIAVTSAELLQFKSYGIPFSQVTVIPNGISANDFPQVDVESYKLGVGLENKSIILFMGRLNKIKGPDLLTRAFALIHKQIPEFHLVFAGADEGMKSELIEIIKKNNLSEYVHFLGFVEGEDKSAAYHMASLLVVPSRQEAMSIVALEAAVCGTPVMLTDQCGFSEVKSICSDFEVSADISGIANGLIKLLSNQEKLKQDAKLLREFVVKRYEWDTLVYMYIKLYKKILMFHQGNVDVA
jgi:glycosyltransferase involved in cell wall biosynthesis